MALTKISLLLLLCLLTFYSKIIKSQNCNCAPNLCCSQFGYCGTTMDYCSRSTCRSGPCMGSLNKTSADPIGNIVTEGFFNGIINQAANNCAGKRFYNRDSFINATITSPSFANSVTRREIAAMFAHFTYETGNFCYIEEINRGSALCSPSISQYPCAPGKSYHGRGPLFLSWNFNYGPCGQSLGLDLLRQPELVSSNPIVAFRTALWIWMRDVRPVLNQGFGATIKAINEIECKNSGAVNAKIKYYREYCGQLGVDPGANLTC